MKRALLALFLAPILGGMLYGFFAMFAIPVMVAIAVVVALPMFFLLRHLQWLQWWFAAIAGALCGLAFAPIYWFTSPPYHVEYIGIRNVLLFVGTGFSVGPLSLRIDIFRNRAFPYVSGRAPISMLLVLPIAVAAVWVYERLEPHLTSGRAIALLRAPQSAPEQSGRVQLRLPDGALVVARLPRDYGQMSVVGQCFSLSERWAVTQSEKLYFIHSPKLGSKYDDC